MADTYGTYNDFEAITGIVFRKHCHTEEDSLSSEDVQALYSTIRQDGLSLKQIKAALEFVCGSSSCDKEELIDVLRECDRRYFLLQDLKWEFSLIDIYNKGSVSESKALLLLRMVHGDTYTKERWKTLTESREVQHADISFEEIEVDLCNIFTPYDNKTLERLLVEKEKKDIERQRQIRIEIEDKEQRERERQEYKKRKREEEAERERARHENERKRLEELEKERKATANKEEEELRKRKEEQEKEAALKRSQEIDDKRKREVEKQKLLEEEEKKSAEEAKKLEEEEEERKRKEALANWKKEELLQQQQEELERLKAVQEAKAKDEEEEAEVAELFADEAAEEEEKAKEEAARLAQLAKDAKDEESRRKAEEEEQKALQKAKEKKVERLRLNLKAAAKSRKVPRIKDAVGEAKESKMEGLQKDIDDAEKVLDLVVSGQSLQDAMLRRHLGDLDKAIDVVKKKNYSKEYAVELLEGEKLANKLRRLERLRKEILELNQGTISEIRSYSKPPIAVHEIMIAVYLILGYKERDLKEWKNMQALLGKTGKESLKRMVTQLEAYNINLQVAQYADTQYLQKHELGSIRDVSAGAATFFIWCTSMVEEADACKEDAQRRRELEAQRRKEEEEEKKRLQEKKQGKGRRGKAAKRSTSRKETPPSRQNTKSNLKGKRSQEKIFPPSKRDSQNKANPVQKSPEE